MCTKNAADGYSPQYPADDPIIKIANDVCNVTLQTNMYNLFCSFR